MARTSILYSGATFPGGTGNALADINVNTGEQYIAQAIGEAGGVMQQVGVEMFKLQANTEFTDAVAADQKAINDFNTALVGTTDEHSYQDAYDKMYNQISSRQIKNKLAARMHEQWITQQTPKLEAALTEATRARIQDNAIASLFEAQAEYEQTGKVGTFKSKMDFALQNGYMNKEEYVQMMDKTTHTAQWNAASRLAFDDPEQMMQLIDSKEIYKLFPNLNDAADGQGLRSIALGSASYMKNKKTEVKNAELENFFKPIGEGKLLSPAEVWKNINSLQSLTQAEKKSYFDDYLDVQKKIAGGGGNPYTATQDYPAFIDVLKRSWTKPEDVEPNEVFDNMMKGTYSINDGRSILNILKPAQEKEKTGISKLQNQLQQQLYDAYAVKGKIPDKKHDEWKGKFDQLNKIIEENQGDEEVIMKQFESLMKQPKEEKAKQFISGLSSLSSAETRYTTMAQQGQRGRKPELKISEPKTQAEYDAIPKGTQYKHPDGTIRIKQ
jgi:hypothetical protein